MDKLPFNDYGLYMISTSHILTLGMCATFIDRCEIAIHYDGHCTIYVLQSLLYSIHHFATISL